MSETRNPEVDIDRLMSEVRESLSNRVRDANCSLGQAGELFELLFAVRATGTQHTARAPFAFGTPPDFTPHPDDHYHLNDLLAFHDWILVWNGYRAILKREPDEYGYTAHLEDLRSGRIDKIDVLGRLRFSSEGKGRGVRVDGLFWAAYIRKAFRLPIVGYLLELLFQIARLPKLARNQRLVDGYVMAQQEMLFAKLDSVLANSPVPIVQSREKQVLTERLHLLKVEIDSQIAKSLLRRDPISEVNQPHTYTRSTDK